MGINFKKITDKVTESQQMAGEIHLHPELYGIEKEIIMKEARANDYTTAVDIRVEEFLRDSLLEILPGSTFLGEETDSTGTDSRHIWVVDPTDASAVYSMNGVYYSNSIALVDKEGNDGQGSVIFGSVYQPATGRQFVRTKERLLVREQITRPNGEIETIERLPRGSKSECFAEWLGCAFGTSKYFRDIEETDSNYIKQIKTDLKNANIQERLERVFDKQEAPELQRYYSSINAKPASGSSALFCCDIADGNRDFLIAFAQKVWDGAVGVPYAQQAGCPVVIFDNQGNVVDKNLEHTIANCDKDTLINVGVFANQHVMGYVMERFNS